MGEASGDMKTAIAAAKDGSEMTATLQAQYMAAGMNRADRETHESEGAEAAAAVPRAAGVRRRAAVGPQGGAAHAAGRGPADRAGGPVAPGLADLRDRPRRAGGDGRRRPRRAAGELRELP